PAPGAGLGRDLVEIERIGLADRLAVQRDRVPGQGVGNGLARLAGHDLVPDLAQARILPEIGLESPRIVRLRHRASSLVARSICPILCRQYPPHETLENSRHLAYVTGICSEIVHVRPTTREVV